MNGSLKEPASPVGTHHGPPLLSLTTSPAPPKPTSMPSPWSHDFGSAGSIRPSSLSELSPLVRLDSGQRLVAEPIEQIRGAKKEMVIWHLLTKFRR